MKTVAIAIPSLHRPDLTARCIESIQRQTLPAEQWKIVVIENEARPDSILPDPLPRNTMRIELPTNEGTTNSINRGMAAVPSPYVLLLNNDVELAPDYLEKLVETLETDETIGLCDRQAVAGQRAHAARRRRRCDAACRSVVPPWPSRSRPRDSSISPCRCCQLVERRCSTAPRRSCCAGPWMPTSSPTSMTSTWRCAPISSDIAGSTFPDAVAYHIGSATLGQTLHPRVVEYITRNQLFVLMKDYPDAVFRRLLPRIVAYQLLWLPVCDQTRGTGRVPARAARRHPRQKAHEAEASRPDGQTQDR